MDDPEISDEEDEKIWISFSSETAWGPTVELWETVLGRHAPNCIYVYCSEEPGMGYYYKNDVEGNFFPEDYLVDCCIENSEMAPKNIENMIGPVSEADLRRFLQEFFHTNSKDTDLMVKKFNEMSYNGEFGDKNFIRVHKYEISD